MSAQSAIAGGGVAPDATKKTKDPVRSNLIAFPIPDCRQRKLYSIELLADPCESPIEVAEKRKNHHKKTKLFPIVHARSLLSNGYSSPQPYYNEAERAPFEEAA